MNKLQIRRKDVDRPDGAKGPIWGGVIEVLINGNVVDGWIGVKLDIKRDEFVVADVSLMIDELEIDDDIYFDLIGIVREGGRIIVRQNREGKVRFESQDVSETSGDDDGSDTYSRADSKDLGA